MFPRQSFCPWVLRVVALAALACGPAPAHAGFIADQKNTVGPSLFDSIQAFGPIGQQFTPTQASLNQVYLDTTNGGESKGAGLYVNIHAGTITGQIVGTSHPVYLRRNFSGITPFIFQSTISLVPNNLYVIEVVALPHAADWLVGSSDGQTYAGGSWVIGGQVSPGNDLWFAEGTYTSPPGSDLVHAPEPASLTLLAIGVAGCLSYVWRRRSSHGT